MFYSASTKGFYEQNQPSDSIEISDTDYNALIAAQRAGKEIKPDANGYPVAFDPVFVPQPNINGFKSDMVSALGGIVAANELLKLYPMFTTSLADKSWANLSDLIENALLTSAITQQQYDDFQTAFDANNIPITLPKVLK